MDLLKEIKTIKFNKEGKVGTDIFNFIQKANEEEMKIVSDSLALIFPTTAYIQRNPQISHTPVCLLVRNIFGTLFKNGTLLDVMHPDRKDAYKFNCERIKDWEKSFIFSNMLEKSFIEKNNQYGLVILYEMLAHRYGDLATFSEAEERKLNIEKMCQFYEKSYETCCVNKLVKQMFTPWYWGSLYLAKLGEKEKAIDWFKMFHKLADKYMSSRESYLNKFNLSLSVMKSCMEESEWTVYLNKLKKNLKNKPIKRAINQ